MADIEVTKDGAITRILLNRPAQMNALTQTMHNALDAAFDGFSADDTQLIAVISGAGERAFCAGSDLKDGIGTHYLRGGYAGLIERFDLSKPVIAAVDGFALGGGFEMALACDLIVATETSSFGLPEPLVGAVALGGGLHRLPRQIGEKLAMELILTSRRVSAQEGLRMGFVNQVTARDELPAVVQAYCDQILAGAPLAIRASKMTVQRGLTEESLEQAMAQQENYPEFAAWRSSEDAAEGIAAFAEKRKPVWQGK
jgi:crotonobetainyl-CoA hydratase